MELNEMKTIWGDMSAQMKKQKTLTESLIIKMTQADYQRKISIIYIPELLGSLMCITGLMYILIDLHKLDTWYLMACGIISELVLLVLPVISLKSIKTMKSVNIAADSYKETLRAYANKKKQFVYLQKMNFYLCAILMLTFLPVMGKLISGVDFFSHTRLWYFYAVAYPVFYAIAQKVFKSYIKTTEAAEAILKELAF